MSTHRTEIASKIVAQWRLDTLPLIVKGVLASDDAPWSAKVNTEEEARYYLGFLFMEDGVTPNPVGREALKARFDPLYPQTGVMSPGAAQMYESVCRAVRNWLRRQRREVMEVS